MFNSCISLPSHLLFAFPPTSPIFFSTGKTNRNEQSSSLLCQVPPAVKLHGSRKWMKKKLSKSLKKPFPKPRITCPSGMTRGMQQALGWATHTTGSVSKQGSAIFPSTKSAIGSRTEPDCRNGRNWALEKVTSSKVTLKKEMKYVLLFWCAL